MAKAKKEVLATKATENIESDTERQTITIGDNTFYLDSVTEEGRMLISDHEIIVNNIKQKETELGIMNYAKNTMFNAIVQESSKFEPAVLPVE
jgi:hypothetical protein